ncbi:MAG: hypothetical protein K0S00_1739 [Xanthobacteraceae bacterium]|nr:hypothetical protein [Xanthobacteraceae bacterium]
MKLVQIAVAVLLAGSAPTWAQTPAAPPSSPPAAEAPAPPKPPLVLLLDGLGVYVESPYIGVSRLTRPLQQQGFQTRTDSHLMYGTRGLVPDVIIGHSMGGEQALRYAGQLVRSGYPAPLVITIDTAPTQPPCPVPRCVNIAGPGFFKVPGAVNISAWAYGARFVGHAQLPTHPAVQRLILQETAAWMAARRAKSARVVAVPKPAEKPAAKQAAKPATTPPPPAPTARAYSWPQIWSAPGWTVPGASQPGTTGNGG